jgi:hypothetical protein
MTSFRQIEANRRNARLSTGPVAEEGKSRSKCRSPWSDRRNRNRCPGRCRGLCGIRNGSNSRHDAQTAVERDLVLRLASLLWRLRRATAIETGLFKLQARQLLQFRARSYRGRQKIIDSMCRHAVAIEGDIQEDQEEPPTSFDPGSPKGPTDPSDDLTRTFVRLNDLPTYPLDRLSRYEAALWRQVWQILFTLECLRRRKPWDGVRLR